MYAFSCASFAHYCYSQIVGPLVDLESLPFVTDDERQDLESILPPAYIQEGPFRRLYPSYLIHALSQETIPFRPVGWNSCKDHSIFIPSHLLSTEPAIQGEPEA